MPTDLNHTVHRPMTPLALCAALALTLLLGACGGGGDSTASTPGSNTPGFSSVQVAIPAASYAADSAELGAWNVLQQARLLCGFGALRQDSRLDAAARAHAKYLTHMAVTTTPQLLSHYEDNASDPFYTGFAPWHRAQAQGYGDRVGEILEATYWTYDVSYPPAFPSLAQRGASSMRNLLNTVYHLSGALFEGSDVGFGADIQTATSGTSRREEYRFGSLNGYQAQVIRLGAGVLATYPCANSINVPTAFVPAYESPNPFPAMTSDTQRVGPPIYLKVDSGQALSLTAASVVDGAGVTVPTTVLTASNDANSDISANEIFVVPNRPLASNAVYQVALSGSIRDTGTGASSAFTRSFQMTTGQ